MRSSPLMWNSGNLRGRADTSSRFGRLSSAKIGSDFDYDVQQEEYMGLRAEGSGEDYLWHKKRSLSTITMTMTIIPIGIWRGRMIWGFEDTRKIDGASPGSC